MKVKQIAFILILSSILTILYFIQTSKILQYKTENHRHPHIVFILVDDYGFNDVGYHGENHGSAIKTPFLDSLAMSGVRLENYYVQPICTPTRSQLLSGRYQIHTGLQYSQIHHSQPSGIPLDNILLPEQFKSCGYNTHMVGKWHCGFYKDAYLPWKRGFDTYFGYLIGSEDYYTKKACHNSLCGYSMNSQFGPTNETFGEYSAYIYSRKAKEIIENHKSSNPLFLYVALQSVHEPLQVPNHYMEAYSHIKDVNRRTYAGMVAAMEETVKNITDALVNAGMWKDTLLIFSSDNGGIPKVGGNNWPLRGGKGTLYEGGIRAVGFVHGKLLNPTIRNNNQLIHVSDWYPTLLSAANCPIIQGTQPLDGVDQWKVISKNAKTSRTEILHNINPRYKRKGSPSIRNGFDTTIRAGIRVGDWKLLTGNPGESFRYKPPELESDEPILDELNSDGNVQLFNIASDPHEMNEVSKDNEDIVKQLLTRLGEYNASAVPVNFPPNDREADPRKHGGNWQPWIK